jgi:hypothetical protein
VAVLHLADTSRAMLKGVGNVFSPAVVANGILYFNGGTQGMYAFHLSNQ